MMPAIGRRSSGHQFDDMSVMYRDAHSLNVTALAASMLAATRAALALIERINAVDKPSAVPVSCLACVREANQW